MRGETRWGRDPMSRQDASYIFPDNARMDHRKRTNTSVIHLQIVAVIARYTFAFPVNWALGSSSALAVLTGTHVGCRHKRCHLYMHSILTPKLTPIRTLWICVRIVTYLRSRIIITS